MPNPTHGGKRRGAGRPTGSGKWHGPTKPVRVPIKLLTAFYDWLAKALAEQNKQTKA
jgi:hypothetical protein